MTAHSNAGQLPEDFDWRALVDPRATTVVYMGVRTFAGLAQRLIAEGADPSTPVMMVESATTPRERRLGASLSTMGAALEKAPPHGPCLFLIGLALRKVVDGARADEATQA